ncbi:hypothetical protein OU997_16195 [Pseudomonas sp. SL4(2022)]|uniref:hypothetical protein n=1 Tax=Pseudomonas sp. SL4(2022) TaxID=2994661 RepID=UPI00226FE2A8|nr:hypothetical protein [Pseudomonas sp. SL4(2022)]WAC43776.1 hypothetical protein OU997_16195 [Pseudomonas sp. SL4(2022)]
MYLKIVNTVAVSIIAAAIIFYAGVFSNSFSQNMCYSDILSKLGSDAEIVANTENRDTFKNWAKFINNMPNHGYESDCKEILKYLNTKTLHAK